MIISATEFWLLDALSEFNISLAQLCLSPSDYLLWRNERKPEVTDEVIHKSLAAMVRAGWLRSHSVFGRRHGRDPRSGIESSIVFKLTSAGGRVWEQIAEPRWHEYATIDSLNPSEKQHSLSNELLSAKGLNIDALVGRLEEYCGMTGQTIRRLSRPRCIRQWKPNYWKRMKEGLAITATLADESVVRTLVAPKPWKKVGFTRNSCDRLVQADETYSL